MINSNLNKI